MEQKTVYLWSRPRSLSTAVVRAFSTLDGCKAINEPYIYSYFRDCNIKLPNLPPGYGDTQPEVLHNLKAITGHKYLFIKEMPGHLGDKVNDPTYYPKDCVHTFLIRHPVKTMKSWIKLNNEIIDAIHKTEEMREKSKKRNLSVEAVQLEQSFKAIMTAYDIVTKQYGRKPVIMDADDLQRNPGGMLKAYCKEVGIPYRDSMVHWGKSTPEQREIFATLLAVPGGAAVHTGPIDGTEFVQTEPKDVTVEDVDEMYRDMMRENIPVYNILWEQRLKPIEQANI